MNTAENSLLEVSYVTFKGHSFFYHPLAGGHPENDPAVLLLSKNLPWAQQPSLMVNIGCGYFPGLKNAEHWEFSAEWHWDKTCLERNVTKHSSVKTPAEVLNQSGHYHHIIYRVHKAKKFALSLAGALLDKLTPEGRLWLVGENHDGIVSMAAHFGNVPQVALGKGSRIYELRRGQLPEKNTEFPGGMSTVSADLNHPVLTRVEYNNHPALFCGDRLDEGTRFLIESLPESLQGHIVDFGCGSGVLGLAAHTLGAQKVTGVDAGWYSAEASRILFAQKNIAGKVLWQGDLSGLIGSADFILTNPPLHTGRLWNRHFVEFWAAQCFNALKKGGSLYLVTQRSAGFSEELAKTGFTALQQKNHHSFVVISGIKPI